MSTDDFIVLQRVIDLLKNLEEADQLRILRTVITFLDVGIDEVQHAVGTGQDAAKVGMPPLSAVSVPYSEKLIPEPKEFMLEKRPKTDVERIAVLAYYLTHYLSTPHFKTLDLSKLNTAAAQRKFANASTAAANALKQGYLVAASKGGSRQLSAAGEQYVDALPDRDAARKAMAAVHPRKSKRRSKKTNRKT